jgi:serine/threonine protein kinase
MPESQREGPPDGPEAAPATDPVHGAPGGRGDRGDRDGPAGGASPGPAATDLELPATFGKYFLTEKLATGGMAEIYLAKIVGPGGFEKQLVIKQIHPRLSGQRHFVDLFVAEAKTLVTLAHGNIVPVYELGVIDDTYFIAMEYIDGPTLYRLTETLRRRSARMEPAVAAWITARILEGLDYAHRKGEGVIHRDLSPRNVMLSRDGEVKLVDFGIAVTLGAGGEDEAGESAPTGSFPYMSPEQVRKEPLTVQTDLFSVGVLFWEMLVGHRLFARTDPDATLHAVVDSDIATPSIENPDVPAKLDEVVMRALERDMTGRWASARDMLAALQRYLYSLDETPDPLDVAALVARYCPPETRRFPTHHDHLNDSELPFDPTRPRARAPSVAPSDTGPPRPGPMTAVIPRERAARGKRPTRARTETFATHVALEEMLERRTPDSRTANGDELDPADRRAGARGDHDRADAREVRDDATPHHPRAAATSDRDDRDHRDHRDDATPPHRRAAATPAPTGDRSSADRPPTHLPGRTAPTGGLLVAAGFGAIFLGAAAVYAFYQRGGIVERPDAARRRDAQLDLTAPAAGPEAISAADAGSASGAAEPPPDGGAATDVRPTSPRHDAGIRAGRPDAHDPAELTARVDAGSPRPTGNATLTIGANPWGNVLLDGKKIGRTPIEHLSVPAGHHVIEVVFAGEDPPRSQKYTVDLSDGDARDVLADFTKP